MSNHDTYQRKIKETGETITVRLLICHKCRVSLAVLPDFLLPKKHYSANEIESVAMQREAGSSVYDIDTPAKVCTVRRWLAEIPGKLEGQISRLKSLAMEHGPCPISEAAFAGLTLMEQLRLIVQKLPRIKFSGNLLGYAGIYTQSLAVPGSK